MLPVINIILLAIALLDIMPYPFYNLLRFVLCGTCIYYSFKFREKQNYSFMWVSISQAIIYNPLIPFYLGREIWIVVNILSIGFLGYIKSKKLT